MVARSTLVCWGSGGEGGSSKSSDNCDNDDVENSRVVEWSEREECNSDDPVSSSDANSYFSIITEWRKITHMMPGSSINP